MKTIEVTIRASEYQDDWGLTQVSYECWIVGKLKEAGVPVYGNLIFRGIKSGTITRYNDPTDFNKCKYIWTPEQTKEELPA